MSSEPIPFHHIIPRKLMMNTKNFNTRDPRRATYPFLRRSNTARKENQTMNELEERTRLIHFFYHLQNHIYSHTCKINLSPLTSLSFPMTRGGKMKIFISSKTNIPTSCQLHTGRQRVLVYQLHCCCSRCQPFLIPVHSRRVFGVISLLNW